MNTTQIAMPPGGISPYYGYLPSKDVGVLFIVLFSISAIAHTVQAFYPMRQLWPLYSVCVCGVVEAVAWAARIWSNDEPMNLTPFILQSTLVTTGPAFLDGAVFGIFGIIMKFLGARYAHVSSKTFGRIFLLGDNCALILQTVGGALSSSHNASNAKMGTQVTLAGIIMQMIVMAAFVLCMTEYVVRYATNRPARPFVNEDRAKISPPKSRTQLLLLGSFISATCLLGRTIYRSAKAIGGATGPLETNQTAFDLFEGAAVAIALYSINFFHPGLLLRPTGGSYKQVELSSTMARGSPDATSSYAKLPLISEDMSRRDNDV